MLTKDMAKQGCLYPGHLAGDKCTVEQGYQSSDVSVQYSMVPQHNPGSKMKLPLALRAQWYLVCTLYSI